MHKIYWDATAQPIGASVADVIYHLRADDADDLLMDAVSVDDFELDAPEVYDALDVEYRMLERKMNVMRRIMNRADADLKVREDNGPDDMGVNITKPFKRNGTQNIAVIFQLTDGQTVTIVLHNPDLDPGNIKPDDHLLSWKWMINKKDVTIVVAPEKGKDLNVTEVARRIMRLASKNSAAFARANARRAERIANIERQKGEISDAEKELAQIESDISAAKVENEELVEQLSNKQKELKQAQDAAAERAKKAEEERKKAEEEAARKAEEERQKAEEEAKRAAEEEAKRKAEEEQKKAQKPAESWETRPLDTFEDVIKFIDEENGWWNPAKPAAQRLLEAVKRLGYTSFKGVDGEGSNVEFRQQDDGLWNRRLNGIDTGAEKGYWTSAMYTLSNAFKNGSLTSIDAPAKPAAPGTTVNEMEAEAQAVQKEESEVEAQNAEELSGLIKKVVADQADIRNAFKRPDMDRPIDIVYGNEKMGIKHLLQRREEDGTLSILTAEDVIQMVAKTIAEGTLEPVFTSKDGNGNRMKISLGESEVVLVKNDGENSWLLTGWVLSKETLAKLKEIAPDERRSAFFNSAPTHTSSTTSRTGVGAGVTTNTNTSSGSGQQNTDPQWEADKAYCERIINSELSQMGEVSAVIDQIMDIWDRADASGIAERSQLVEQAYNLIEKTALEAGKAAIK